MFQITRVQRILQLFRRAEWRRVQSGEMVLGGQLDALSVAEFIPVRIRL